MKTGNKREKTETGEMNCFIWRPVTETFKAAPWRLAFSETEIKTQLIEYKKEDPEWTAEIVPFSLTRIEQKMLAGKILGMGTSRKKRNASRENGKLGGRPKKDEPN